MQSDKAVHAAEFCLKFWDSDHWDEWAGCRFRTRWEARVAADAINRFTSHRERVGCFGGHRYRVRRVCRDG